MNGAREIVASLFMQETHRQHLPPGCESALEVFAEEATHHCNSLGLAPSDFIAHLARHRELVSDLDRVHVRDLVVAAGCLVGNAACIEELERIIVTQAEQALGRFAEAANTAADVCQQVRIKLLMASERPPRLATYSGLGSLQRWVRVVLVRTAINAQSKTSVVMQVPGTVARDSDTEVQDPELLLMRETCGQHFHAALEAATASLSSEELDLLRLHVVQGLGIDRLSRVFGVSRATMARRLAGIRQRLYTLTREWLRQQLQLSDAQTDSILRFVRSQVDLSVRHVVARAGPTATGEGPPADAYPLAVVYCAAQGATALPSAALEAELAQLLSCARARWQGIVVAEEPFLRHLAARVSPEVMLERLEVGDLYLAFACLQESEPALGQLAAICEEAALRAIERVPNDSSAAGLHAELLGRLVAPAAVVPEQRNTGTSSGSTASGAGVPQLALYDGRATMRRWIEALAVRILLGA